MTKKQFKYDFLRGLGSALLALKTCKNPQQYYAIVLYGCLHNTTYDIQVEGDRGWYLYQSALLVDRDSIEKSIIKKYACFFKDYWLFVQLTSILYYYAEDGSELARTAIYNKYNFLLGKLARSIPAKRTTFLERDMFEWVCVYLTSLDGWSAFKKIVKEISEMLLPKDSDCFFNEWFYSNAEGKFGDKRMEAWLQKQAEKSEYIHAYWQKAQEWNHFIYEKTPLPTLEDVIASVDGEKFHGRGIAMRFARNASPNEIEKLVEFAMHEPDTSKKAELLWGLRKSNYPFSNTFIMELLQSENKDIRDTAFFIMENHPSPQNREYALSLIQKGEENINAISLLSKNILPQDEQLFCNAIKAVPIKYGEGDWHSAFRSAEDGIKKLRGKPKTDLPEYIYRQTYCGFCRECIVRLMHKKKILTESILSECQYDSNSDIREFAERLLKGKLYNPTIT